MRNPGGGLSRRAPWLALVIIAVASGALVGLWFVHSRADPNATAKQVAVNYTYARLTQQYSTWWDSVAPVCRQGSTKEGWINEKSAAFQGAGIEPDPAATRVQAGSAHTSGNLFQVVVHIAPPGPRNSADVEVDLQRVNGSWLVVGYGYVGSADRCNVL